MHWISGDSFIEIYSVVKKNKLRTFLTGFSVAWGIFMLVLLMGSSKGLQNSIEEDFKDWNKNGLWVWPGKTSRIFKGQSPGKKVMLYDEDTKILSTQINAVEHASSVIQLSEEGIRINFKNKYALAELKAVQPDYNQIELKKIVEGRFINILDERDSRDLIVISSHVRDVLFGSRQACGKIISVGGAPFKVAGVFEEKLHDKSLSSVFIPMSTARKKYTRNNEIHLMAFSVKHPYHAGIQDQNGEVIKRIRKRVAARNNYSLYDPTALNIFDVSESVVMVSNIFKGLRIFIWTICFMTLLSGIIGISNIMIVTVNERIREIGIRKAIGATPWSIVSSIVMETVVITFMAGFGGLLFGVFTVHRLFGLLPSVEYFKNPSVDIRLAFSATIILVIAGTVAGMVPAIKASSVNPVDALKNP
jgi:putative ABC transport system permease protein